LTKIVLVILILFSSVNLFHSQTNPCISQNSIKIVVLGSSTAAGTGPSAYDSAWVNRYRNYLLSLNPSNQVVNLAQGGYTTYKIMRTGFTPPPGRPTPDVNKNITAALALNPDAIIVNMPSNDVSNGFSYQEQMNNLDSVVALANSNNVPIWICTTQPKNFSNAATRQLQEDLKDSILIRFAPNTLDFWTTIALSDNSIDPNYDSGDGTHLNDAAHAIFNNRVIDLNLPLQLYVPTSSVDYAIIDASPNGNIGCGDSSTLVTVVVANLGITETSSTQIIIKNTNQLNGIITTDTLIQVGGISTCSMDTFIFNLNLYEQGNYELDAYHLNTNDTISQNDTLHFFIQSSGHPTLIPNNDSICNSGIVQFSVSTNTADTVLWFANSSDTIAIGSGNVYNFGSISSTTTLFAEAIRGNLFFDDSLKTTTSSTTNWNGAMFDLVAHDNIIVDSFQLKINTLGVQEVELYTKPGTHLGYETNSTPWTYRGSVLVNVTNNQNYTNIPLGSISINNGDTMGMYFQMTNTSSLLSYRSVSAPITRSTNQLEIITGSGSSHNFGGNYFPRDLNCGVYYHYGNRPQGECSTGKVPVTVFVGNATFNLGNDTIIDIVDVITLYSPPGYTNHLWSNGSTADSLVISASTLGFGIHYISLSLTDSLGCQGMDSIVVAVADLVGMEELHSGIYFYPNPTKDKLHFSENIEQIKIYDLRGVLVYEQLEPSKLIYLNSLSEGTYILEFSRNGEKYLEKVVKNSSF
jgi:lysophospholipase L1-like esterase